MFGAIPIEKGGARVIRCPPLYSMREGIVPVSVAGSDPKGHASISVLGACPTLTVLLQRTIRDHLRRARPDKNPQRIPANTPAVFAGLRPRIWPHLLCLVTKAMSDRLIIRGTVLKRARRLGSEGQPNVDRPLGCPDSRASRQARYPEGSGFSYFGDESFSVQLAHTATYYLQPEGGICS